jgi:hypothetical protein
VDADVIEFEGHAAGGAACGAVVGGFLEGLLDLASLLIAEAEGLDESISLHWPRCSCPGADWIGDRSLSVEGWCA